MFSLKVQLNNTTLLNNKSKILEISWLNIKYLILIPKNFWNSVVFSKIYGIQNAVHNGVFYYKTNISFLFVKLPLLAILYAVVINYILSFKLTAISDLLTSKGIVPLMLIILLAYLAFKNYTSFKDLRENYKAKNIDGINILVKLIRIHDMVKVRELGFNKTIYNYTFSWEDIIFPAINNHINGSKLEPLVKKYSLQVLSMNIPAKMIGNVIYVDPKVLEECIKNDIEERNKLLNF